MQITRCASSHLMAELIAWRNPQGTEENWAGCYDCIERSWNHTGKIISTEIGLGVLIILSAIETVAYSALSIASLTLYPLTDKPCTFFAKLLQSSAFTVIWGLADVAIYNPFFENIMTHESFARYWAEKFNPTSITMFRSEDRAYLAEWQRLHPKESFLAPM